jgi:SWI/SNF-related matrix-associated actin-dependent regulator 1 of chromatin subfamily A
MTILLPFQQQGVRQIHHYLSNYKGCILADDMGLGKTIQSIAWWHANPDVSPIIIVCPAIVKENWEREILIHSNTRCRILNGRRGSKIKPMMKSKVLIINYEILHHWLKFLRRLNPALVVVDECHRIKNMETIRSKAVTSLCKRARNVILTSGSPLLRRPAELYPSLHIARPDMFKSFTKYAFRYCKPRMNRGKWEYKGAERLDELHNKIFHKKKGCMIRRMKKDVLDQLPDKTRSIIPIKASLKEYEKFDNDFKRKLIARQKGDKNEKTVKQLASSHIIELKRICAKIKLNYFIEWLDNFLESSDEKIIVFAIHKNIIKALKEKYKHSAVVIDGSTSQAKRRVNFEQFNNNKKVRILIANEQAAGEGWNGTVASNVAVLELAWSPIEHDQLEDRIYRIGQKKKCFIHYFILADSVEEKICVLLDKYRDVVEAVLHGKTVTDFNMMERLTAEYVKLTKKRNVA